MLTLPFNSLQDKQFSSSPAARLTIWPEAEIVQQVPGSRIACAAFGYHSANRVQTPELQNNGRNGLVGIAMPLEPPADPVADLQPVLAVRVRAHDPKQLALAKHPEEAVLIVVATDQRFAVSARERRRQEVNCRARPTSFVLDVEPCRFQFCGINAPGQVSSSRSRAAFLSRGWPRPHAWGKSCLAVSQATSGTTWTLQLTGPRTMRSNPGGPNTSSHKWIMPRWSIASRKTAGGTHITHS